jgi:putative lipoprotein
MRGLFCVLICLSLPGCGGFGFFHEAQPSEHTGYEPEQHPLGTTFVYDCGGYEFIARFGPGEVALWLPEQYVVLPQARSASGTLYEEGDTSFWSKGEDVMVTFGTQQYLNCQVQPQRAAWEDARRRGVVFRAVGNAAGKDPGWQLEINRNQQMLFATDYGMQRIVVENRGEKPTEVTHRFQGSSDSHTLRVEIRDGDCEDTVNKEILPAAAVVTLDATRYQGCGRYLAYPWQDE